MITNQTQSILFISDLHLDQNHPEIEKRFLQLLSEIKPSVEALYILGDLFETWLGDDIDISQYRNIIAALKKLTTSGLPIYFICGNRDFLIGKQFFEETGCQPIADETRIIIYDEPVLLMHGDMLCTRDVAYLKARKILRNPFLQKLFLLFPAFIRKKIAANMRKKSREHTAMTPYEIMDVTHEEVSRLMNKHNVSYLVHGHTHRPAIHEFQIQNKPATRIVLGAWHDNANALIWHKNGKKELVSF